MSDKNNSAEKEVNKSISTDLHNQKKWDNQKKRNNKATGIKGR